MKNSHTNYSCLCATEYQTSDPLNTFVCIKCKNTFHISCYDNPTIQILNNSITCIRCRLEIAEPYLSLKYPYLVSPIVLQKEKPVDLSFKLNLTNEDKNHILLGSKKVAIFCTKLKSPVLNNFMYEWPNDKFEISFQGNPISYNIYSYAFLKEIDNYPLELKLVCKEPLSSISVLGVALADKVEIKEIAKEIAKKNRLSSEDAKKKYEDMRQNEMDFSAGIPIKDPMTSFIIYMPVRGFNCEHIDCFDLMSFLSFNRSNFTSMRWKCPICKIVLNSNEIVIDLYLHKIIKEIRSVYLKDNDEKLNLDKFSHIFFDENGEWKYKENFSNVWSQTNQVITKDKNDSENEKKNLASQISINQKPLRLAAAIISKNIIEIPEEDEEAEQNDIEKTNIYPTVFQECLNIIKSFQSSKDLKEEKSFRIFQVFQDKSIINSLPIKEFYELLQETQIIYNLRKASFLEDLYSERDNKLSNIEDLCNELENTIGLLCRLILVWSDKKESLLKIVYLMITNNDQTNIDPFKMLEYFILISDLLSKNFNQFHELNPENFENTPDFFGDLMRNFLERIKRNSIENFKKIIQLIIFFLPELYFPLSLSDENKQRSFQVISSFMNSFLLDKNDEDFIEIIFSLYPCSTQLPTKLDLKIVRTEIQVWSEIFKNKKNDFSSKPDLVKMIKDWNKNTFLQEYIESGILNIPEIINLI